MTKVFAVPLCLVLFACGCGSKEQTAADKPVEKAREAIKDAVTQDFKILESAKDALKQSQETTKAALEQVDKEAQ